MPKADPNLPPTRRLTANRGQLEDGKTESWWWDCGDGSIKGFALRVRRADDGRIVDRFYYQRRGAGRHELGDPDEVTETQMRKKATTLHAQVVLGGDPQAERSKARADAKMSLKRLGTDFVDHKRGTLKANSLALTRHYLLGPKPDARLSKRKRKHTESWIAPFHSKPAASITPAMVSKALVDCEKHSGKPSASALRSNLSAMFSWGIRQGCYGIETNPCIYAHLIEKAAPSAAATRVLSEAELVTIWRNVDADSDFGRIVRLLILTGLRRSEIGGMKWSELDDVEHPTRLSIPAERMKHRIKQGLGAHVVPVTPLMAEIITKVHPRAGIDCLFGGWRGKGYTGWDDDKKALDARTKITPPWTIHAIRRSTATHLGHMGVPPHIVEEILAHTSGGTRDAVARIYNKSSYAGEVRAALTMWSDHIHELAYARWNSDFGISDSVRA